jgi:hypothetical protein
VCARQAPCQRPQVAVHGAHCRARMVVGSVGGATRTRQEGCRRHGPSGEARESDQAG